MKNQFLKQNEVKCDQDEAQAAASWCARPVPSAEAAANDGSVGRDGNCRDRDAAADSDHAPSAQLTGRVALDAVAGATCHIAWRALAQTRRAGGGKKTTLHHTPAGEPRRF